MKNLKTIEGYLSVKELGESLKHYVNLMVDNSEDENLNNLRLIGVRNLCDLYEMYNNNLIKIKNIKRLKT